MPQNDEFRAFLTVLLWILALVTAVGGATAVVSRMLSPYKKLRADVDRHAQLLHNDKERLDEFERAQRLQLKGVLALIDNKLTNNSVERLSKVKSEINDFLINR